jgi:hypothetical protein
MLPLGRPPVRQLPNIEQCFTLTDPNTRASLTVAVCAPASEPPANDTIISAPVKPLNKRRVPNGLPISYLLTPTRLITPGSSDQNTSEGSKSRRPAPTPPLSLRASSMGHAAGVTRLDPPGDSEVDGRGQPDVERDRRCTTASSGRPRAGVTSEQQSGISMPHR